MQRVDLVSLIIGDVYHITFTSCKKKLKSCYSEDCCGWYHLSMLKLIKVIDLQHSFRYYKLIWKYVKPSNLHYIMSWAVSLLQRFECSNSGRTLKKQRWIHYLVQWNQSRADLRWSCQAWPLSHLVSELQRSPVAGLVQRVSPQKCLCLLLTIHHKNKQNLFTIKRIHCLFIL